MNLPALGAVLGFFGVFCYLFVSLFLFTIEVFESSPSQQFKCWVM